MSLHGRVVMLQRVAALGLASFALSTATAQAAPRLEAIRARGVVTCGVTPRVAGFSQVDRNGKYSGFDVDICRAVAAAIFGAPDRVRYVQASSIREFLASSDIDIVSRRLTWTMEREALGVLFGPIMFFDGQGFLVPRSLGIKHPAQVTGGVCVEAGSANQTNLEAYIRKNAPAVKIVAFDGLEESRGAFDRSRCAAYSADITMLGAIRSSLPHPQDFEILSEQISKEPLAQLVRNDDPIFFGILRWTIFALIQAEELGVTSANVEGMLKSGSADIQYLLGVAPGSGRGFGLDDRWAYNVIKGVGNYGEMFERNVGQRSAIKLARGLNSLWTAGGLIFAPPLR